MLSKLIGAIALSVFIVVGSPAQAASDPAQKCEAAKLKATGKQAATLLKALAKDTLKPDQAKLDAAISKAQSKFTKTFTKAEAKGGCRTEEDAAALLRETEVLNGEAQTALEGDAYVPPDPLPPGQPGDLISARPMHPPRPGTLAWRVLYLSQAVDGTPVAVSGVVAAPAGDPPPGGRDVVSWAHGAKGIFDICAPSRGFITFHNWYDLDEVLLQEGYVAVATDYEGLGTPGVHPFIVGESEGRGVLDIVRAARQIPEAGASERVVVLGRSQGGHAALFAGELAASYAPELDVLGVVAAAPVSNLVLLATFVQLPGISSLFWVAALAYEAVYGDVGLDEIFTPEALAALRQLAAENQVCLGASLDAIVASFPQGDIATLPGDVEPWPELLQQNSPGIEPSPMPLLVVQGDADVFKLGTDLLVPQLCALGDTVEYRVFPGTDHDGSTRDHLPELLAWIADRFAGLPPVSTCE